MMKRGVFYAAIKYARKLRNAITVLYFSREKDISSHKVSFEFFAFVIILGQSF